MVQRGRSRSDRSSRLSVVLANVGTAVLVAVDNVGSIPILGRPEAVDVPDP